MAPKRRSFWAKFYEQNPDAGGSGEPTGSASQWWDVEETGLVISTYVAQDSVGLFIRGKRGVSLSDIYSFLQPYEAILVTRLGREFGPQDGVTSPFSWSHSGNPYDPEFESEQIDWLYETASNYLKVLTEVIGANGLPE